MINKSLLLSNSRKNELDNAFFDIFGNAPEQYFSAPGRSEISGNHTDHQRGRVLAAAVNLDTQAAVRRNSTEWIRIQSKGYPMVEINLKELSPVAAEINTTAALVRGVAARFVQLGCTVEGFDAYIESTVLPGSGLSSSAAFEVLIGTIINHMFFGGEITQPQVAQIAQYAENVYFGKPCGLMDQMASAVGGLVSIDFADKENPVICSVDFDFSKTGYALCIIDSQADHADLTDEYSAITLELKEICNYFHKDVLTQVSEEEFYANISALREKCGDRAVMRAIHVFNENKRVPKQVACLEQGDFDTFLMLETESGRSSWMCLQNVIPTGSVSAQAVAITLALCEQFLQGRGAYRVHGGGFAGTVQAFVPQDMLAEFCLKINSILGENACHVLSIRPQGGVPIYWKD